MKIMSLGLVSAACMVMAGCSGQMVAQPAPVVVPPDPVVKPSPVPLAPIIRPEPVLVPAPKPVMPKPVPKPVVPRYRHTHSAIPGCTGRQAHAHPYRTLQHKHRYSCAGQQPKPVPVVPKVKSKGEYKGPVPISRELLKQYGRV